jgi:hypothetical protein
MNAQHSLDRWSLLMHQAVADRLAAGDVEPLRIARANLARWDAANDGLSAAQAEWVAWLACDVATLVALLREPGENATRLRSTSPFAGAISNELRLRLFDEARAA